MSLSDAKAERLVGEVSDLLQENNITWQSVKGRERRVTYIPFSKDEDTPREGVQEEPLLEAKKAERNYLMLRSFGKAVQEAKGDGTVINGRNVMDEFRSIEPEAARLEILERVAAKTPLIVRHGEPMPEGSEITKNDSIEIAAHGRETENFIQNCGTEITAAKVLKRMQEDFGGQMGNIGTIKLTSCGSSGTFFGSFTAEAADIKYGLIEDADIDGYENGAFVPRRLENALDHLGQGNRFVSSAADLGELRNLKRERSAALAALNAHEEAKRQLALAPAAEVADEVGDYVEIEGDVGPELPEVNPRVEELDRAIDADQRRVAGANAAIEAHIFDPAKFQRAQDSRKRMTVKESLAAQNVIKAAPASNSLETGLSSSSSSSSSYSNRH